MDVQKGRIVAAGAPRCLQTGGNAEWNFLFFSGLQEVPESARETGQTRRFDVLEGPGVFDPGLGT